MLSYKESLKILKEANALIEGHFILSSGLHSSQYVQCAQLMSKPDKAIRMCESLAEKIKYISSKDLNIEIIDSLKKPEYSGDNTLLLNEVKDFKFTPINKSIESLYNYYNLNKQIIKKELFQY